jgi:hypothetical protein
MKRFAILDLRSALWARKPVVARTFLSVTLLGPFRRARSLPPIVQKSQI